MRFTELQKRFLTAAILLPIIIFITIINQHLFILLLISVLVISFYEWFNINKKKFSILTILGFLIILFSIYSAYYLKGNDQKETILFLWIIFVCIFSDMGGYFFGKFLGGKKITKISPNKTYAGMFGSFIFSIFPVLFLHFSNYNFFEHEILFLSPKILILSLLFSFVCQAGDITVSYFKRKNNIKDSGKLLPGHGGLLDRIDGIIFVLILSGVLKIFKII